MVSTIAEGATGASLILAPSLVNRLLLGSELAEPAALARVFGIALVALALACWPRRGGDDTLDQQCLAMLLYNACVGTLLAAVGLGGWIAGALLWPATVFHLLIAGALVLTSRRRQGATSQEASSRGNAR
jgi:hypothetical protein